MNRVATFIFVLLVTPAIGGDQRVMYTIDGLSFGALLESEREELESGCGCWFYYPPRKKDPGSLILGWLATENPSASMFVQGRLTRLRVTAQGGDAQKVGGAYQIMLNGHDASLEADLKTSSACPSSEESCSVRFEGQLQAKVRGAKGTIPVWGACGC